MVNKGLPGYNVLLKWPKYAGTFVPLPYPFCAEAYGNGITETLTRKESQVHTYSFCLCYPFLSLGWQARAS